MSRPVAIVTGDNGVFGRYICQGLIATHDVVCVVRRRESAEELLTFLGPESRATYAICDLSDPSSILTFAQRFASQPVQCLINNAAIIPTAHSESAATGEELQWCVNVMSYHRMTRVLLESLKLSATSTSDEAGGTSMVARVVFVASYYVGGLRLDDPEFKTRPYDVDQAYRASKQANQMLAYGWSQHVASESVVFSSCHPGVATSNVSLGLGYDLNRSEDAKRKGATTPLYCALSPDIKTSGLYYINSSKSTCDFASDANAVQALWDICESTCRV